MKSRRLLLVVAAVIATLGVAMVFVYAKSADARAAEQYDTVEVLVATKKIQPGESFDDALERGKIEKAEVVKAQVISGAVDETDPFQDTVALTTIYPQEQLLPVKFGGAGEVEAAATLPIPEGKLAISILVTDDGRVGKFIGPGAEVAVIFTDLDGSEPVLTKTLLERVTVLAAGTSTTVSGDEEGEEGSSDEIQQLLTVAVSQQEAERVRFAEKDGELSAALLNDASEVASQDGVTKDNLLGPGE